MKYQLFIYLLLTISCNTKEKTLDPGAKDSNIVSETPDNTDDKFISTTPLTQCYAWAESKDSAFLMVTYMDDRITGDLVYDWNEKDNNKGTIDGFIKNNTINAWYTFQSEGVTSVREVIFKTDGTSLLEGYGEIATNGDTVKFKNREAIKFAAERPFNKINCK